MSNKKTILVYFSLALGFVSGAGAKDAAAGPAKVADPPLTLSIASVMDGGSRTIGLRNEAPHFDVVLRNASNKPLELWAEDCSGGNGALSLEIVAIDGKPLPQAITVERRDEQWGANAIRGVTLLPGDVAVREIHLYQYKTGERSKPVSEVGNHYDYTGFPILPTDGSAHVFRMRAVFEEFLKPRYKRMGIWSGRVVSDTRDYRVWGIYP